MTRVLITGANGWIAGALGAALVSRGVSVWGLTRHAQSVPRGVHEWLHAPADLLGLDDAWAPGLTFDVVMHLAARVHVPQNSNRSTEQAYMATNSDATLYLAKLARARGVRRFVFLSSIKALGEADSGRPWREDDVPHPEDAYGRSKLVAEQKLAGLDGIETVVLRPPLVYGPGVRANFARLLQAISRGWPLPLGCANAERSLIYLDNLVDALIRCAEHPDAAGRVFHVADSELLTVRDLLRRLGDLLHHPARLLPVPLPWLRTAARLAGRGAEVGRLTEHLRLDTGRIQGDLAWRAPVSAFDGLSRTTSWYRTRH